MNIGWEELSDSIGCFLKPFSRTPSGKNAQATLRADIRAEVHVNGVRSSFTFVLLDSFPPSSVCAGVHVGQDLGTDSFSLCYACLQCCC